MGVAFNDIRNVRRELHSFECENAGPSYGLGSLGIPRGEKTERRNKKRRKDLIRQNSNTIINSILSLTLNTEFHVKVQSYFSKFLMHKQFSMHHRVLTVLDMIK
jgi:hypothetical protein